jgi:isocitrate lyase
LGGAVLLQADEIRVPAVEHAIQESGNVRSHQKTVALERYREATAGKSNAEARNIAADILGSQLDWDWDRASFFAVCFPFLFDVDFGNIVPRTREGYYHTTGGIDAAVSRALAFAPWADMIWLETKTPDLKQAQSFARRIREKFPGKWLVYNLSPSFNWSAHGYSGMYRPSTEFAK